MEKRKMLTFDAMTRICIESAASVFLLFCAGHLLKGALDGSQSREGGHILLAFALIFTVGGAAGLVKSWRKYRAYRKDHPKKR